MQVRMAREVYLLRLYFLRRWPYEAKKVNAWVLYCLNHLNALP